MGHREQQSLTTREAIGEGTALAPLETPICEMYELSENHHKEG